MLTPLVLVPQKARPPEIDSVDLTGDDVAHTSSSGTVEAFGEAQLIWREDSASRSEPPLKRGLKRKSHELDLDSLSAKPSRKAIYVSQDAEAPVRTLGEFIAVDAYPDDPPPYSTLPNGVRKDPPGRIHEEEYTVTENRVTTEPRKNVSASRALYVGTAEGKNSSRQRIGPDRTAPSPSKATNIIESNPPSTRVTKVVQDSDAELTESEGQSVDLNTVMEVDTRTDPQEGSSGLDCRNRTHPSGPESTLTEPRSDRVRKVDRDIQRAYQGTSSMPASTDEIPTLEDRPYTNVPATQSSCSEGNSVIPLQPEANGNGHLPADTSLSAIQRHIAQVQTAFNDSDKAVSACLDAGQLIPAHLKAERRQLKAELERYTSLILTTEKITKLRQEARDVQRKIREALNEDLDSTNLESENSRICERIRQLEESLSHDPTLAGVLKNHLTGSQQQPSGLDLGLGDEGSRIDGVQTAPSQAWVGSSTIRQSPWKHPTTAASPENFPGALESVTSSSRRPSPLKHLNDPHRSPQNYRVGPEDVKLPTQGRTQGHENLRVLNSLSAKASDVRSHPSTPKRHTPHQSPIKIQSTSKVDISEPMCVETYPRCGTVQAPTLHTVPEHDGSPSPVRQYRLNGINNQRTRHPSPQLVGSDDEYDAHDADDTAMLEFAHSLETRKEGDTSHSSTRRQVFPAASGNTATMLLSESPPPAKRKLHALPLSTQSALMQHPWSHDVKTAMKERFHLRGFRPNQLEAINATLSGKDTFVLMPTGGGKSLCYQLPSVISSGHTKGVTVVISPLLSLMQDQVEHLKDLNIQAFLFNSEVKTEHRNLILKGLRSENAEQYVQVLYVTPEMINKSKALISTFHDLHRRGLLARIVIDEAHCVSEWGHDFRPDYKALGEVRSQLPGVPVMALTATATENVKVDVIYNLNIQGCKIFTQSFNRPNLSYEVRPKGKAKEVLDSIADTIHTRHGGQSGIIYCLSRSDCERLAAKLRSDYGIDAHHYHAGMEATARSFVQKEWQAGRYLVIVATIAFGMGIDKADVRFVIHHTIPKSLEGYYQETGRAGRDGKRSGCYLYYGYRDTSALTRLINDGEGSWEQKDRARKMLRNVVQFCENRVDCRRVLVLGYFNESFRKEDCKRSCDNCCSEGTFESRDYTEYAALAVSLVRRLEHEKVTLLQCLNIFQGAKSKKTNQADRPKPPEFGAGADLDREDAERIFTRLLGEEALVERSRINGAGFATKYIYVS